MNKARIIFPAFLIFFLLMSVPVKAYVSKSYVGEFTNITTYSHMFDDWVVDGDMALDLTFGDAGEFEKLEVSSAGTANAVLSNDNPVITGSSPFDSSWEDVDYHLNAYNGYITFDLTTGQLVGHHTNGYDFTAAINPVPVPGAVVLFGTGILGFFGIRVRRKLR